MKHSGKNILLKILFASSLLIIVLIVSSIAVYFLSCKSTSNKFNFASLYKVDKIEILDDPDIKSKIENIKEIISKQKSNAKTETEIEILDTFQELIDSISFEIISSKTIFNKSKLNVNFSYYDLSRHITNYFKNSDNMNLDDFLNSLKSIKYKTHTNLDITLNKKDGKWRVVLSEKLLNILSGGLYKNFLI